MSNQCPTALSIPINPIWLGLSSTAAFLLKEPEHCIELTIASCHVQEDRPHLIQENNRAAQA